jgi:hypothetical protein
MNHQCSEFAEFVHWLADYVERPIDSELIQRVHSKNLHFPVTTLLYLGHGAALKAVTTRVMEIIRKRPEPQTEPAVQSKESEHR